MARFPGRISRNPPLAAAMAAALVLMSAGCMAQRPADVAKSDLSPAAELTTAGEIKSWIIQDLKERQTILAPNGPYMQIAEAVIAAGSGAAEAELRLARLRADARAKNWLPRLGQDISLTSLGALAASLVADQALFDHGRRRAERNLAAAEVELAAIAMVSAANNRVYDGLKQHIEAERAEQQAVLAERATAKLAEFERLVKQRVEGGISDRAEQQIITQALVEMRAALAADRQQQQSAQAALATLTLRDLSAVTGLDTLPADQGWPEALALLEAEAQASRSRAEAEIAQADMTPGLRATAGLGKDGIGAGLGISGGGIGFGRKAERAALEGVSDLAGRRVAEARENARRQITDMNAGLSALLSQETQARAVLDEMAENLRLYTEQYKVGRRSLVDLVRQYEAFVQAEREHAQLRYRFAELRLRIARDRGVLVNGDRL